MLYNHHFFAFFSINNDYLVDIFILIHVCTVHIGYNTIAYNATFSKASVVALYPMRTVLLNFYANITTYNGFITSMNILFTAVDISGYDFVQGNMLFFSFVQ